eukprot:TCONS_00062081-protein
MADWNEYFSKTRPPSNLDEAKRTIQDFAVKHHQIGRNIVLVTSGGTTVPVESNTVRFVDNFSQGTRGAASAEYFLLHGYAVIFLHRQRSFEPFCRHFEGHNALDLLELQLDTSGAYRLTVDETRAPGLQDVVRRYKEVQNGCLLLKIGFMTLSDYLFLLRASSEALSPLGRNVMFYLAAAVSDFYIPDNEMAEHKIQSSDKNFVLNMSPTPKMLSPLVREWAKNAFVVSFKLETDMNIITKKAREALQKYNHQVVIANILQTRKKTVILITPEDEIPIWMSDQELDYGKEIEEKIVGELFRRHSSMISGQAGSGQVSTPVVNSNISFSSGQPQYQSQTSINASNTSTSSHQSSMPGLAPINVYPSSNPAKLQNVLLHLKSTNDAEMSSHHSNEMLGATNASILKRSVSAKEDSGGLTQEMQEFIREFKTRRVNLGYTQDDVGRELSALNGPTYSQSFISRFEGKQLGMKAAERMRPILDTWIQSKEVDVATGGGNKFQKKRRKRTSFSPEYIQVLNDYFQKNAKPTPEEMQMIANKINMDLTTVKVWFCNKKQSLKRVGQPSPFHASAAKSPKSESTQQDRNKVMKRLKSSDSPGGLFALNTPAGMKTLIPVSTPTGTVTMPFFISQDGNPIPIVSGANLNNGTNSGVGQTPGQQISSTLPQQIVHLSQVPILTSMVVNNTLQNNGTTDNPGATQIISGGRIIPSGSVLQLPGGAIASQQALQQSNLNQASQNTLNDPNVLMGSDGNNSLQTRTSVPMGAPVNANTPGRNNENMLLNKDPMKQISEKDLESDEVCVADESMNKNEKLVQRNPMGVPENT